MTDSPSSTVTESRASDAEELQETKYLLPHDEPERKRLAEQYNFLKHYFRKESFPSEVTLQPGARLLESGAGTGAWALDAIALAPPGSTVTAIDISSRLFPSGPPGKVTFSTQSILSLPSSWSTTFDLAHQRLLLFALGRADWAIALRELYRVLKPGGTIILEESSGRAILPEGPEFSNTLPLTRKACKIVEGLARAKGCMLDCWTELPELVKSAGFEVLARETKAFPLGPGDIGEESRAVTRDTYAALSVPIVNAGIAKSAGEWDGFLDEVLEECKSSDAYWEFYSLVARKPL